ncbi:MAG: hypothetical protein EHM93_15675 [Bacteroidales bacterium]|nr:MAG: hypothetical protein EHM93_15675 [Bacteroidales bacterium]
MLLADILKIVLPALLVFLAGYLAMARLLRNDADRRKGEIMLANQRISTPIRLQAYERLVLFLERISPESMIVRVNQPSMTAQNLQSALLSTIRAEWEHNLSQQLYVSNEAWELTRNAKGNMIKLINICAERVDPDAPSIFFSQKILELMVELEQHPTSIAIDKLKKEVGEFF